MVKIRLARFGKKKQPTYRLVVSDARKDTQGTYIESVGSYNPSINPKQISIKADRIKYWLSVGAQASPTVHNLLVTQGIIEGSKVKASKTKVKKKEPKSESEAKEEKIKTSESAEAETKESAKEEVEAEQKTESKEPGPELEKEEKSEKQELVEKEGKKEKNK